MLLRSPSGGLVDASGDEAKRLIGCGFVPVEQPKAAPKKPAPRKRKTASK